MHYIIQPFRNTLLLARKPVLVFNANYKVAYQMPAHKPLPLPILLLHQIQGVFDHLALSLSLRLLNLWRYLKILSQLMTRVNYRNLGKCNYRLQFTSYLLNFNRSVDNEMVSVPPAQQKTYLVFESALLLLFNLCIYCGVLQHE